ncbi:hypothetical protein h2es_0045 [Rickettsiales endosymbiont of Trichoplax sp. H2]|nr:hypothetical protein [Rickettsiales endosymbiont of Trichoplax sp. H2]
MGVMEEYIGIINIQESKAQLDKSSEKNNEPLKSNVNENSQNINATNSKPVIKDDFQLQSEKKLLQELRQRRKEIEQYNDEVPADKLALESVKQYIDKRLSLLENLQNKLKPQLKNSNKSEEQKIQRLVKVYENMKPKEAAKIFNDLQIGILIEMSLNMKESKLALILAEMKPEKVRELTSILATQNDLMELD